MSSIQSTAMARAAAAAAAAAAATAASTSNDSALWSDDAVSLLAAASATQQQATSQIVQDQNQHLHQSSTSPTSMLLLHQRNQSFGSGNNSNFITPIGRPQSGTQQIRSSPPIGSIGSKLGTSQIDANFAAVISESSLNEGRTEFGSCNSLGAGNTMISGVTSSSIGIPIANGGNSHLNTTEISGLIGASAPAANFHLQHLENINGEKQYFLKL